MENLLFAYTFDVSMFQIGFALIGAIVVYFMFFANKKTTQTTQVAQPILGNVSPISNIASLTSPLKTEIRLESDPTVELVTRWKALRDYAKSNSLDDATKKLDELFPLLNGVKTDGTSTTK